VAATLTMTLGLFLLLFSISSNSLPRTAEYPLAALAVASVAVVFGLIGWGGIAGFSIRLTPAVIRSSDLNEARTDIAQLVLSGHYCVIATAAASWLWDYW